MRVCNVVWGAAYIGPFSEWSWVTTLGVIAIGVILLWALYKLVINKRNNETKHIKKVKKVKRVVITDEDMPDENGITPIHKKEEDIEAEEVIAMPFSGELMELSKVPDPVFSEKMVGDGFAVKPSSEEILAPVNGMIKEAKSDRATLIFNTTAGRDVVLHIGLNANEQGSTGVNFKVKEGDRVSVGQKIGTLDLNKMKEEVTSIISPIIFPNLKETERIVVKQQGKVEAGMKGIVTIKIDN